MDLRYHDVLTCQVEKMKNVLLDILIQPLDYLHEHQAIHPHQYHRQNYLLLL